MITVSISIHVLEYDVSLTAQIGGDIEPTPHGCGLSVDIQRSLRQAFI